MNTNVKPQTELADIHHFDHFQQNETGFQLQELPFAASVRKTDDLTLQPCQPGSNLVYYIDLVCLVKWQGLVMLS